MSTGGSTKAIFAAMAANAGIAVAKFVAFVVTGSSSMLAESIHSVADTSNQALLLLGNRRSRHVADDVHQFGYGRERYFWSFIVAMVIFTLGGLFSIFEGVEKILDPHEVDSLGWAIGVLLFAMVAEGLSFRTAVRESRPLKGQRTWWQFIRTSRSPELPVVLLEDSGALVGLVLALIGVSLTAVTGNAFWDGLGTLSIGVLLVVIALTLTVEMKSLLIGESATRDNIGILRSAVEDVRSVTRVLDFRTQHLGPEELLIATKLEFDRSLSTESLSRAIDEVERALRSSIPMTMHIYVEPDLFDPERVEGPSNADG